MLKAIYLSSIVFKFISVVCKCGLHAQVFHLFETVTIFHHHQNAVLVRSSLKKMPWIDNVIKTQLEKKEHWMHSRSPILHFPWNISIHCSCPVKYKLLPDSGDIILQHNIGLQTMTHALCLQINQLCQTSGFLTSTSNFRGDHLIFKPSTIRQKKKCKSLLFLQSQTEPETRVLPR